MKASVFAFAAAVAVASTGASAQVLDLSGQFRCVQGCLDGHAGQQTFVTQNGRDLNLVNEIGEPSKGWIDWPGHIWAEFWHEGAVYSPDGMTIQFDRGTIWQRVMAETLPAAPLPPSVRQSRRRAAVVVVPNERIERVPVAVNAYDGDWSVRIMTQSGPCGPEYRYGIAIRNGAIFAEGGEAVNLQGHVSPGGLVHVSLSAGGQQASGEGRLSPTTGSGTWQGAGSSGACTGVWQAARRE